MRSSLTRSWRPALSRIVLRFLLLQRRVWSTRRSRLRTSPRMGLRIVPRASRAALVRVSHGSRRHVSRVLPPRLRPVSQTQTPLRARRTRVLCDSVDSVAWRMLRRLLQLQPCLRRVMCRMRRLCRSPTLKTRRTGHRIPLAVATSARVARLGSDRQVDRTLGMTLVLLLCRMGLLRHRRMVLRRRGPRLPSRTRAVGPWLY